MRRFLRLKNVDISLQIKNDAFIRPPRDTQRNWLINSALKEFAADLEALDGLAAEFVPGSEHPPTLDDRANTPLADQQIMEDWQIPLMKVLAEIVADTHGSVLEIGFGRGVASGFIQQCGVATHTIIECNDSVVRRFEQWRQNYPGRDIRIVHGLWQDVLDGLGRFDGILFHTYPLNETEYIDQVAKSITFAEHFFPHAAAHLAEGGVFTYLSNEIDSLSRAHQRLLLRYFGSICMRVVERLPVPADVKDAWWADSMVAVKAVRQT